jgi:hypothetical protein
MARWVEVKHSNLGLHKILAKCNDNKKKIVKFWKMNVHARFLKFFFENDSFLSLITI